MSKKPPPTAPPIGPASGSDSAGLTVSAAGVAEVRALLVIVAKFAVASVEMKSLLAVLDVAVCAPRASGPVTGKMKERESQLCYCIEVYDILKSKLKAVLISTNCIRHGISPLVNSQQYSPIPFVADVLA